MLPDCLNSVYTDCSVYQALWPSNKLNLLCNGDSKPSWLQFYDKMILAFVVSRIYQYKMSHDATSFNLLPNRNTHTYLYINLLENKSCVSPLLFTKSFTIVTSSLSDHLTHMAYFTSTEVVCIARQVILLDKKDKWVKTTVSEEMIIKLIVRCWYHFGLGFVVNLVWTILGNENLQANTLMLIRLFQVDPIPVTGNSTLGIGSFGTTDCLYWPGRCSNKLKQQICLPSISSVSFMNYCKKRWIECNINESANIMAVTWITIQQWEVYWYFQCVAVISFSCNSYQSIGKYLANLMM